MRFLILNQFVPPDGSPTAKLAGDLARVLEERGHQVQLLGVGQSYRAGGGGLGRWWRDGVAWMELVVRACEVRPRPHRIVALSSPPCLLVAAALVARWHGAGLVHWAMDVYPQTAVALGALPGWAGRVLEWGMDRAYRECGKIVALDEDMAREIEVRGVKVTGVVAPWPPDWVGPGEVKRPEGVPEGARVWMYSGNLGRAHEVETLLEAQWGLEARGEDWWLVFQGGGAGWRVARRRADELGLRQCVWLPHASEEEAAARLAAAAVLVATRRPEVRGLLWPSKLAVALAWPRRVVWVGERDSAVARAVAAHPGSVVFACGQGEALGGWLAGLPREPLVPVPVGALAQARVKGMARWVEAALGPEW